MNQIKQLLWVIRDDGVVHTDPTGLRYAYYIIQIDDTNTFELSLIENDGHYDEKMCTVYTSINEAQQYANMHFKNIVSSFLI